MSRISGFQGSNNNRIYLNVYDLNENNEILFPLGLGMYHSGVQVGNEEYTFGTPSGIFSHPPKAIDGKLRESIDMGEFKGTRRDLETIINSLRPTFQGQHYHVLNRNCNCFSNELMLRLIGTEIPAYVNRMAYYGSMFSCFLPEGMANNAPVEDNNRQKDEDSNSYQPYSRPSRNSSSISTVKSQPTNTFESSGHKLGSSQTQTIESSNSSNTSVQDRKEKLRAAALSRFNNPNQI